MPLLGRFFIYFDDFQGVPQVLSSSICVLSIVLRLLSLEMLSAGLPFAISNIRGTHFTANARFIEVFGDKIVNFGIPKYHPVQ